MAPKDDERVMVVLSDRARSSAFLLTSSETAVLSPDATDILRRSFVAEIGEVDAARGTERERQDDWGRSVVDEVET